MSENAAAAKAGAGCGIGCVSLVVIVALVALFSSLFGGDDEDDGGGEYGARDVCEQFVEARLKAPSTADFSDTSATEAGGTWTVTGAVDSENGFGAMLRSTYVCKVTHTGGDDWSLVDITLN